MSLYSSLEYLKWYLLRGEVPPLWRLIPSKYRPTENAPRGISHIDDEKTPCWLNHEYEVAQVRNRGGTRNRFYGALVARDGTSTLTASVTPPEPAAGVSFDLLNTRHADEIEVSAEGTTEAGEQVHARTHLRTSDDEPWPIWSSNVIPVDLTFDEPVSEAELRVDVRRSPEPVPGSELTVPAVSIPDIRAASSPDTPVFLISVDSLRYDALPEFEPAVSALGPSAVVPADPWTQGHWTRPSHATMLSGTHPGTHGYVAGVGQLDDLTKVSPEVPMVAELLRDAGYRCAACVARMGVSPTVGFGRGFQSYEYVGRDWELDRSDASSSVEVMRKWLTAAVGPNGAGRNVFYFLHLFDPHYPYVRPARLESGGQVDIPEIIDFYRPNMEMDDFVTEARNGGQTYDEDSLRRIRAVYDRSVEHTGRELARLFEHMKQLGVFEDALIIVTGDHGEQFFDRGFAGHSTLRDENLRPAMVVKPSADSDLTVPDRANTIDFAPTICDVAGVEQPAGFAGDSWVSTPIEELDTRPRITEAIYGLEREWYTVAVQHDGLKAVFCWPGAFPHRPDLDTVEEPPEYEEFFRCPGGEDGSPVAASPTSAEREKLLTIVREFVGSAERGARGESVSVPDDVVERLENLGYR